MEGLKRQPDFHDLLRMEDDCLSPSKGTASPERGLQNSLNSNASKINTPAKVLMVGEPVQVKTELSEDHPNDKGDGIEEETSGSSIDDLARGINTPSPETAAAMESLIAADDLTAAPPKLDVVSKSPTPVNFTTANANRVIVRPQTSIMSSLKSQQPISMAGKKFMVATQPVQVVRKEGGGGPIVTKFVVKRTSASAVSSQKSPVVFTKGKVVVTTPAKGDYFKSGSILLSPIKGGFKIPISPIKSPMKVSVIPPVNSQKLPTVGKPITVPIQTSIPQLQRKPQGENNAITALNGIVHQSSKGFVAQQPIPVQNRQDSQGMKIQYVQLLPQNNGVQQPTLRSNQGQPITFTSMGQISGTDLSLNQPSGAIAFLPPNLPKLQQSASSQRKAQTVKVAIPSQSTHQIKPQRLIMPATSLSNQAISALSAGNISYAMVPAKYVEQLTKQLNAKTSFSQDSQIHAGSKPPVKVGSNGKLRKPCNCTKSQCLKLYCECFANGQFCDDCNCINCFNNLDHEAERSKAVKQCLERNPSAFRPKIGRGKDDNRTHQKGCNCKRSGCLKNYCECYEARIPCTSKCKCIGCKNYEESGDRRSLMSLADAAEVRVQQQTAAKTKLSNQIGEIKTAAKTTLTGERLPYTFFTQEVIEATCTCLLAQAEEAEKTSRPMAVAEAMILEEFGRCVMQIIQSAGKAKVSNIN